MPIIKNRKKLFYYAHVPKCAGTSVEDFLIQTCSNVSFLDRRYLVHESHSYWAKTSPQHIDGESLGCMFAEDFFELQFTLVRNPIKRFVSAFKFNKHFNKFDELLNVTIDDYVSLLTDEKLSEIGYMDNHFLPMYKFMIPGFPCHVFRMESDLDDLELWLKRKVANRFTRKRIKHTNSSTELYPVDEDFSLSDESVEKLKGLYADDYRIFAYDGQRTFERIVLV